MRRLQARGDAPHQFHQRLEGQRAVRQDVRQRLAIDELHGQIGPLQRGFDRKNEVAHDGVVQQMMQRRGFPAEQGERGLVFRHFRQKHLDGDDGSGLNFVTSVDLAHSTGADHLIDLVDAVEARARRDAAIGGTERLLKIHDGCAPDCLPATASARTTCG